MYDTNVFRFRKIKNDLLISCFFYYNLFEGFRGQLLKIKWEPIYIFFQIIRENIKFFLLHFNDLKTLTAAKTLCLRVNF